MKRPDLLNSIQMKNLFIQNQQQVFIEQDVVVL